MTKQEIRRDYLSRRKMLSDEEVNLRSALVAQHFFRSVDLTAIRVLHTFLPIRANKEPDTWIMIDSIRKQFPSIRICIPRISDSFGEMEHFLLESSGQLKENQWGIPEPGEGSTTIDIRAIDAVLVPLLAFDETGHRVGYGKGFYDRFLLQCRPDTKRIGVSLFEMTDKIDDIGASDVPLHCCITPSGLNTFLEA